MIDPLDSENRQLDARLGRTRMQAGLIILLERLTDSFWRFLTWAGFFCGLWLFQIPSIFGNNGEITALLVFITGAFYFVWTDILKFRFPSRRDIDLRIEQESALKHRPLSAMDDNLANPQKWQTRRLWEESRAKIVYILRFIRSGHPRAFMAAKDPYALRLGVILFLGLGIFTAGPMAWPRLMAGLMPFDTNLKAESADKITMWITPPQYTGVAPVVLRGDGDRKTLDIPSGSILKINVRGGVWMPRLESDSPEQVFKKSESGNYILETQVPPGTTLRVKQGFFTRGKWAYRILPDTAPQIRLKGEIEITADGPMRVPLEVQDDYGVKTLTMNVEPDKNAAPGGLGEPVHESRAVMSPPKTVLAMQPIYDLTSHMWAGQPVAITFTAEDGAGQKTTTAPIRMILPERPFHHPVAKQLIDIRKQLAQNPEDHYLELANEIEHLMIRPGDFLDDHVVFLALRAAASNLIWADPPSRKNANDVALLLWDTALRIEGGEISIAERNLRDAQNALQQALDNPNTTPEQLEKLMTQLRGAMNEYFNELSRELQKRMAEGQQMPTIPPELLAQTLDADALENFMQQLEDRMKAGDKKGAQEMIGQLQRLMDMLNPSMAAPMPKDMQMMNDGIAKLQELIRGQKELLDRTKIQAGAPQSLVPDDENETPMDWHDDNPPTALPHSAANSLPEQAQQEELRKNLGDLMMDAAEALNQVPENLGKAEQEMRASSSLLGENRADDSIPHQEQTIDHLEQGQQQLSQQLMQRMQQMTGMMMGQKMQYDPLGRPYGGNGNGNGFMGSPVKIPNEAERKKSQELLKLIRRKSGELDRPAQELDYYRRLLKQF